MFGGENADEFSYWNVLRLVCSGGEDNEGRRDGEGVGVGREDTRRVARDEAMKLPRSPQSDEEAGGRNVGTLEDLASQAKFWESTKDPLLLLIYCSASVQHISNHEENCHLRV